MIELLGPDIHPTLPLLAGALAALITRGHLRRVLMLAAPIVGLVNLLGLDPAAFNGVALLGADLTPVRLDGLSLLFGVLFHVAAFLGVLFALHHQDTLEHTASMVYAGAAIGAVCAGDLLTFFIFWELLALSSAMLILARRDAQAIGATLRYLIVQVSAGVLLLAGAILLAHDTGSLAFGAIGLESAAGWLILAALGIKAAFPLVHAWLTDAYPAATPTGAVFLSALTTKVAIYALARGFAGTELLIYVGVAMALFPILYGIIENDVRRVLSFSLIDQLGFMVVAIGIGTELALNGAAGHAFVHVIYKSLLFMSIGAVVYATGEARASELGGLARRMPWTAGFTVVGAASISALPLFSGFVTKSMIMSAVVYEGMAGVWLALMVAAVGVVVYVGVKVPYAVFFSQGPTAAESVQEAPLNMRVAMGLAAALCVVIGLAPGLLYAHLPWPLDYSPYDVSHVLSQLQLVVFAALAFAVLLRLGIYPRDRRAINLDSDWLYRRAGPVLYPTLARPVRTLAAGVDGAVQGIGQLSISLARGLQYGSGGLLGRPWSAGFMAFWVAVLLGVTLVLYYLR